MNTNIYTNIKLVLSAAAAGLLVLSSCSKWTEPEALDFAGMGDVAADSEEYLAALRAFKQTDHKVMILRMDATAEQPFSRFQHISAMPDSADYICVRNAVGGIYPAIADEIAPVRENKGTKVICDVDYMAISDAWDAIEDAKEDGEAPGTDDEFVAYVAENRLAVGRLYVEVKRGSVGLASGLPSVAHDVVVELQPVVILVSVLFKFPVSAECVRVDGGVEVYAF